MEAARPENVLPLADVPPRGMARRKPLPLSAAAHQMFMMASTAGHGGEDDSAVIKIFPGIELPGKAE